MGDFENPEKKSTDWAEKVIRGVFDGVELWRTVEQNKKKLAAIYDEGKKSLKKDPRALRDVLERGISKGGKVLAEAYLDREKERARIMGETVSALVELENAVREVVEVKKEAESLRSAAKAHVQSAVEQMPGDDIEEKTHSRFESWAKKIRDASGRTKEKSDQEMAEFFASLFK